jgi:hypothetical protein
MSSKLPQQPIDPDAHVLPPGDGGMPKERSKFNKPPKPQTDAEKSTIRGARGRRQAWEQTIAGQNRTTDITQHYQDATNDAIGSGRLVPSGGPGTRATPIPKGMLYELTGRPSTRIGPGKDDVQLPGMTDPSAAPRPPKWEELSQDTRRHTERALAAHGTSMETMQADLGSQHDQAHIRAMKHGADLPHGTDFYSSGEPRQVIDRSAKELGIPQPVHAALNAITSPNVKFKQGDKYPNNEAAVHVVNEVNAGVSPHKITNDGHQGYATNMRKAGMGYHQYLNGKPMEDWRGPSSISRPEGKGMMGPKTGPYANSWSDTHPQFFVSDVHSGGGGALPHLRSDKPIMKDAEGNDRINASTDKPMRDKSEREKAIAKIPYFHSAVDHAARGAMQERGLTSLRDFQATQWGEERIQRGAQHGASEADVYKKKTAPIRQHESLF